MQNQPCRALNRFYRPLPQSVRGLVLAVKAYERTAIRAAVEKSWPLAQLAMLEYPIIGQWEIAEDLRRKVSHQRPGISRLFESSDPGKT